RDLPPSTTRRPSDLAGARSPLGPASSMITEAPRWASTMATSAPQMPEPTTTKSADSSSAIDRPLARLLRPAAVTAVAVAGRHQHIAHQLGVERFFIGQHPGAIDGLHHAEKPGGGDASGHGGQLRPAFVKKRLQLQRIDTVLVDQGEDGRHRSGKA